MESAGTDIKPGSIYKSREGEAEIQALYDEALDGLRYESLTVGTRGSRSAALVVKACLALFGTDRPEVRPADGLPSTYIRVRRSTLR